MNSVHLLGRITRDLELRGQENKYLFLTLAVDKYSKTGKSEANFIECRAFGKTAETMVNFLQKGSQVVIEGSIDVYTKPGTYEKNVSVIISKFYFTGKKEQSEQTNNYVEVKDTPVVKETYDLDIDFEQSPAKPAVEISEAQIDLEIDKLFGDKIEKESPPKIVAKEFDDIDFDDIEF